MMGRTPRDRWDWRGLARLCTAAAFALLVGGGCGNADDLSPRERWISGDDPMEVPQSYERQSSPDDKPVSERISLYDPNRPEEQKKLVLQPNVYALDPDVADKATIDGNRISLPLEGHGYLARRKAGDIVISPDRDFAWRRIKEVTFEDSTVHWKTERPEMTDVIRNGYFYVDADASHPEAIPEVDLAEPYLSGPLEMFRRGADGELRTRAQPMNDENLECDLPVKCEPPAKVDCGTNDCPCSSGACSNADQCGGDGGTKHCELDPCDVDGTGKPKPDHPGTCVSLEAFGDDPDDILPRCSKPCTSHEDCGDEMYCSSTDGSDGYCTTRCKQSGASDHNVGPSLMKKLLEKLTDTGGLGGLDITNHPYFDVKANVRTAFDVDLFPVPGVTISAVAEADFLTGLGLLFKFDVNNTWEVGPASVRLPLARFTILGWPFSIKLELHGRLKLETTAKGRLKVDYKLYSTRLATPQKCDPGEGTGCEEKLPWKDHSASWETYKSDHSGGDYGGPPRSEDNTDPVIGTYAQEAEDDKNYGIAYGASFGSDPNCLGYDKWCSKGDFLGIFGGALIHKRITDSLFGVDVDTSIENYLTGEAGANVGLYTPTGPSESRLFFVEPINFLASSFAVFDPPFCGFGFDLFYRAFLGIGPIDLFGLITLFDPPVRFPFFSPIQLIGEAYRATPACYVPEGQDEPLDPRNLSDSEWSSTDWKKDNFWCSLFRTLAEIDAGLACGAPADIPEPSQSTRCPCGDAQACVGGVCVEDPSGAVRVSMVGGSSSKNQGLYLAVTTPSGERVEPKPVEIEGVGQYQTLMTTVFENPESGVYLIRVVNEAGASLPVANVPYLVDISGTGDQHQEIEGTIKRDEHAAPFTFRYRHDP